MKEIKKNGEQQRILPVVIACNFLLYSVIKITLIDNNSKSERAL